MRKRGKPRKPVDLFARFNLGESQRRSIGCVYHANLYDQQIAVAKRGDITATLAEIRHRYETGDYFQQEAA